MNADEVEKAQRELEIAFERLAALLEQCQRLLANAGATPGMPADDAVEHLLHRLGDHEPVDDFEAGRRRDRRLRQRPGDSRPIER